MRLAGRLAVALAATTHDWAPAGLALTDLIAVSCTGTVDLTGLVPQQRERLVVIQVVAGTLNIRASNGGSAASNQFGLDADLALPAGTGVWLYYDQADARWRAITPPAAAGPSSGSAVDEALAVQELA